MIETLSSTLDVEKVRKDFPALERLVHGDKPLVYLDNAATSQKPRQVLDAEREYLEHHLAPVHRGASAAVGHSTTMFEDARATVARFVGAGEREIVWTENATDAINMVALGIADASAGLGGASAALAARSPGSTASPVLARLSVARAGSSQATHRTVRNERS